MVGEQPADRRQLRRPPPASAGHDRRPDDSLQHRDLLADRGLRVTELGRGGCERSLAGNRPERGEVAQLQPSPEMTIHEG